MRFRQSSNDFPLTVSLGEKTPSFGLKRWGGNGGLRFIPPDDEGFTLRGDKRRLLYKGRRRSHRFSILGDCAFEYDCILLREPESNVISLCMEGAENFDFFRQPDFVKEPFLRGSYAVYKKETLTGEGTGKLCHIHRPEIIDAGGRRCWGELSVANNRLNIAIPEKWLGEAAYPVIVDPTIGTSTVGSQLTGVDPDNEDYDRPFLDGQIAVCKYPVSQGGSGLCTAFVYCYYIKSVSNALPVVFTDNNNKPYWRISRNQEIIDTWVGQNETPNWKSGTFILDGGISASTNIWFGMFSSYFSTRFDYGGECYKLWPDEDLFLADSLPQYLAVTQWDSFMNIRYSWYFTYSAAQNYARTLTQGVTLADSLKTAGEYKRTSAQTVNANTLLNKLFVLARSIIDTAFVIGNAGKWLSYLRRLCANADSKAETGHKGEYCRFQADTVQAAGAAFRGLLIFARIVAGVFVRDYLLGRFLKARSELILKSRIAREIALESRIN